MKNVTLLERQLQNAISAKAHIPVFFPDGKSCIFYGNQQVLTVDTVSELIAGLFSYRSQQQPAFINYNCISERVFDEKIHIRFVRVLPRTYHC